MELRKKFKELRLEKGWTQKEVAEKLFVSEKTISSWECGHRQMDTDAIEALCKLYSYELQPEEKKESNFRVVSFQDIVNNNYNLSAKHYIDQMKVTLRVDISQKVKRGIRNLAEVKDIPLDEVVEEALSFYLDHMKVNKRN